MMEKYGAEIQKYEVVEISEKQPNGRVVGSDLTLDDATTMAKENIDFVVKPL